jgi:hypothetical protein
MQGKREGAADKQSIDEKGSSAGALGIVWDTGASGQSRQKLYSLN